MSGDLEFKISHQGAVNTPPLEIWINDQRVKLPDMAIIFAPAANPAQQASLVIQVGVSNPQRKFFALTYINFPLK